MNPTVMSIAMKDMGELIEYANANNKVIPGPVFNVVGYGADPTGVQVSTEAIQNAIDDANAAGGGVVYLPSGTYLTGKLKLYRRVILNGSGRYDTKLLLVPFTTVSAMIETENFIPTGEISNPEDVPYGFAIQNMTLDGNRGSGAVANGINIYGYDMRIIGVIVQNFAARGIYTNWNVPTWIDGFNGRPDTNSFIEDVQIKLNGKEGLYWQGPNDSVITRLMCYSNSLEDSGPDYDTYSNMVVHGDGYGLQVSDSHFWNTGKYQIEVEAPGFMLTNSQLEGGFQGQLRIAQWQSAISNTRFYSGKMSENVYTGNGSTKTFNYTFRIDDPARIKVFVNNVLQVVNTDFTVTGLGSDSGGTVTFTNAPASGARVVLALYWRGTNRGIVFDTGADVGTLTGCIFYHCCDGSIYFNDTNLMGASQIEATVYQEDGRVVNGNSPSNTCLVTVNKSGNADYGQYVPRDVRMGLIDAYACATYSAPSTVAVQKSHNIGTITKTADHTYRFTFASAALNNNYAVVVTTNDAWFTGGSVPVPQIIAKTTTYFDVFMMYAVSPPSASNDPGVIHVIVTGMYP